MWVFCNGAFVSAVQHNTNADLLLVRARVKGHLEAFLKPLYPTKARLKASLIKIERHEDRDYLYRVILRKSEFAEMLSYHAEAIDYGNYKNSISDRDYHDACSRVWSVMNDLQGKKHGAGAYVHSRYRKPA